MGLADKVRGKDNSHGGGTTYLGYNFENVRRWYYNAKENKRGRCIWGLHKVLYMPVHVDRLHYILLQISWESREICVYCSENKQNYNAIIADVSKYCVDVEKLNGVVVEDSEWTVEYQEVPRQYGVDCALNTLANLMSLLQEKPMLKVKTAEESMAIRQTIFDCIIHKSMAPLLKVIENL